MVFEATGREGEGEREVSEWKRGGGERKRGRCEGEREVRGRGMRWVGEWRNLGLVFWMD